MNDQDRDAEPCAPGDFITEGLRGTRGRFAFGIRQVDEVGSVGTQRLISPILPGGHECSNFFIAQRRKCPLPLIPGEDLKGLSMNPVSPLKGLMKAPGYGHVRAEQRHHITVSSSLIIRRVSPGGNCGRNVFHR